MLCLSDNICVRDQGPGTQRISSFIWACCWLPRLAARPGWHQQTLEEMGPCLLPWEPTQLLSSAAGVAHCRAWPAVTVGTSPGSRCDTLVPSLSSHLLVVQLGWPLPPCLGTPSSCIFLLSSSVPSVLHVSMCLDFGTSRIWPLKPLTRNDIKVLYVLKLGTDRLQFST